MFKKIKGEQFFKGLIVLACIVFDCICFYTTFNLLLRQEQLLNILTVGVVAITMDMFPVVLGRILSQEDKNRMELGLIGTILVAFLCEAFMAFIIRINTRSMLFGTEELNILSSNTVVQNLTQTVAPETRIAQIGICVLLGIIPILTSLLSFAISYENPKRRKKEQHQKQLVSLKKSIHEHQVNIQLLEEELNARNLEQLDNNRFIASIALIDLMEVASKIKSRQVLASNLSNPDATTILMEENGLQKEIEKRIQNIEKAITDTDKYTNIKEETNDEKVD